MFHLTQDKINSWRKVIYSFHRRKWSKKQVTFSKIVCKSELSIFMATPISTISNFSIFFTWNHFEIQWNLPIAYMLWIADKMFSPKYDNVKLPPNSGYLSITDKFFKTRRCPLFRGFTVSKSILKPFRWFPWLSKTKFWPRTRRQANSTVVNH